MSNNEVKAHLDGLIKEMGDNYQIRCHWKNDNCLKFDRKGANGQIVFDNNKLAFTLKVGFMLLAFTPKIEMDVRKYMQEHIT